ncbi:putative glycerol-3-phosphate dehydrogenase [Leucosporidium creatinivorum]|uniref:Glycerol-3-phosphate dehydrogenase n=1 Tax=Leucosporidium creatinivorum TaxID=106004 RepID=A0A1Y2E914_9BASI|nr:putative glycerol-3-phosphate dehydrogenase [Leucosporidium creatinivorum]
MDGEAPQHLDRPSATWTPPTRAAQLAALGCTGIAHGYGTGHGATREFIGAIADKIGLGSYVPREASEALDELTGKKVDEFDLLVVGGGATGAGVALDAASRGLKVAVVERDDFSSGTSSKSTKLVHGGVRYLQKAVFELDYEQYKLVREALHERKTFLHTAPYLSHSLPIMLPIYTWWQIPYFYSGCKMYDLLAGSANMESSYLLGKGKAMNAFPMLKSDGLRGAVVYYDGQHNDSRMNMALITTAVQYGAVAANHTDVTSLIKNDEGKIIGARMKDNLTGRTWETKAKGVINATGPFTDGLRSMDEPTSQNIVAPASGVHITLPNYYAPAKIGLIDPATSDGRVIFFLPWQGNTIAGTTDSAAEVEQHPIPKEEEIEWILNEVRNYLSPDIRVRRGDVLSAWSGLRPLVKDPAAKNTESLVRNHMINVSKSGLLTIAGGKWTTYRAMAEETVDRAIKEYDLKPKQGCVTEKLQLIGSAGWSKMMFIKLIQQFGLESDVAKHLADTYGDRAWAVCAMAEPTGLRWPVHGTRLDVSYPYIDAEVTWACRREYACTAVDVIARRTRLSFLNAEAALEALPRVIDIMAVELGWGGGEKEKQFKDATKFLHSMGLSEARVGKLKLDDVRQGRHKLHLEIEDEVLARTIFTPEELQSLKDKFGHIDADQDGKISASDLARTLRNLGQDVPRETVLSIIREVDADKSGKIEFQEFLDIAAGVKELHLSNAFSDLVSRVSAGSGTASSTSSTNNLGSSSPTPGYDDKRHVGANIPVEKSGGGV